MNNTRKLLREDLLVFASTTHFSHKYITSVLGVQVPLTESYSFETRKLILREHIILENFLDSIKSYVGSEYNKVIEGVKGFKDFALLMKDLITNPELLDVANNSIKKTIHATVEKITQTMNIVKTKFLQSLPEVANKLDGVITHIGTLVTQLSSKTGWQGFLVMLGFTTLLKWLETSYLAKVLNTVVDFTKENVLSNITNVLSSFKTFFQDVISNLGITDIITWLGKIGTGIGIVTGAAAILAIIAEIVAPVIKSVMWSKKLVKK